MRKRERETGRERPLMHWLSFQMVATLRAGSGWSQNPETSAWSLLWLSGTQILGPSSTAGSGGNRKLGQKWGCPNSNQCCDMRCWLHKCGLSWFDQHQSHGGSFETYIFESCGILLVSKCVSFTSGRFLTLSFWLFSHFHFSYLLFLKLLVSTMNPLIFLFLCFLAHFPSFFVRLLLGDLFNFYILILTKCLFPFS